MFCFSYWQQLVNVAAAAGVNLVFDMDDQRQRFASNNTWDPVQAELLLQYNADHNVSVHGWELGNEPGHFNTRHPSSAIPAAQLAADFVAFKQLLLAHNSDAKLFGVDVCDGDAFPVCGTSAWMGEVLAAMDTASRAAGLQRFALDGVTVHFYVRDC